MHEKKSYKKKAFINIWTLKKKPPNLKIITAKKGDEHG